MESLTPDEVMAYVQEIADRRNAHGSLKRSRPCNTVEWEHGETESRCKLTSTGTVLILAEREEHGEGLEVWLFHHEVGQKIGRVANRTKLVTWVEEQHVNLRLHRVKPERTRPVD